MQNINEFMKINNSIYKDINDIISNDDISYKLKNLINLYYKFNTLKYLIKFKLLEAFKIMKKRALILMK